MHSKVFIKLVKWNSRPGVLNTTLCDKVCQWFAAGRWFSSGTPLSSTCEWMSDCCLTRIRYFWRDVDEVRFVLDHHGHHANKLSWIFIVLAHWNNSLRVYMLIHSDTLSWFLANQSLFLPFNTVYLVEKQQISLLSCVISAYHHKSCEFTAQ